MEVTPMQIGPVLSILLYAALSLSAIHGTVSAAGVEGSIRGLLDGKVYVVERGEKGETSEGKDLYIFRDQKFRSTYHEKHYGFGQGAYTAAQAGDTITFSTKTNSETHGTIHWQGTVTARGIDVRYTWVDRKPKWYQVDPKPAEHWARSVVVWPTVDPGPPEKGVPSHLLDGRIFLAQSGEQGKETSHHDDYLVFRNGMFVSSDCVESLDFRESTYSATVQGSNIRFRAETTSPRHGTMIWDGTVRGNIIDATARWIHKKWYWTIDRMYWFKGRLLD